MEAISFTPSELRFPPPLNRHIINILTLRNLIDASVAFKIKTTSPNRYCVRPRTGVLKPGDNVEVLIILQPQADMDVEKLKDKFLVQCITEDVSEEMNLEQRNLWSSDKVVQQVKLKCSFDDFSPEEFSAGWCMSAEEGRILITFNEPGQEEPLKAEPEPEETAAPASPSPPASEIVKTEEIAPPTPPSPAKSTPVKPAGEPIASPVSERRMDSPSKTSQIPEGADNEHEEEPVTAMDGTDGGTEEGPESSSASDEEQEQPTPSERAAEVAEETEIKKEQEHMKASAPQSPDGGGSPLVGEAEHLKRDVARAEQNLSDLMRKEDLLKQSIQKLIKEQEEMEKRKVKQMAEELKSQVAKDGAPTAMSFRHIIFIVLLSIIFGYWLAPPAN